MLWSQVWAGYKVCELTIGLGADVKSCRSGPASEEPCCMCLSAHEAAGYTWDPGAIPWQISTVRACGQEHQQLECSSRAQRLIHPDISNWGDWASQGQLLDRTGCP